MARPTKEEIERTGPAGSGIARTAARRMRAVLSDTSGLLRSHGTLSSRPGLTGSAFALGLSMSCLLAVVAFHFPEYLTTPLLRRQYSVDLLRGVLFGALLLSGGIALANIIRGVQPNINIAAFVIVLASVALGGASVPVGDFPDDTPYIGLDWFVLDLLASTLMFVVLERLFPLYPDQPVFRPDWQTDLVYFTVNHLLVGLALLTVNFLIHRLFGWLVSSDVQQFVARIPFVPQVLACVLVADLTQYWVHRAYHQVPALWRFHAVHHSIGTMDWLAGSRLHVTELVATRVAILGAITVFGFDKTVIDAYIVIVGFHAVLNHANLQLPWGPLKYVLVTPRFHHWHHASDRQALDRNYAAHFAFLDYLFGTAVRDQAGFPVRYGVVGEPLPKGFLGQFAYPFRSTVRSERHRPERQ